MFGNINYTYDYFHEHKFILQTFLIDVIKERCIGRYEHDQCTRTSQIGAMNMTLLYIIDELIDPDKTAGLVLPCVSEVVTMDKLVRSNNILN